MEDIDMEWKLIWKNDYLKTVSAFYNTVGGRMIIGVDDDGSYVGADNPKA